MHREPSLNDRPRGIRRKKEPVPRTDTGSSREELSATFRDLEFTLKATAQTGSLTMLQPAVRMLRPDEELSKFGWIGIRASQSGKLR